MPSTPHQTQDHAYLEAEQCFESLVRIVQIVISRSHNVRLSRSMHVQDGQTYWATTLSALEHIPGQPQSQLQIELHPALATIIIDCRLTNRQPSARLRLDMTFSAHNFSLAVMSGRGATKLLSHHLFRQTLIEANRASQGLISLALFQQLKQPSRCYFYTLNGTDLPRRSRYSAVSFYQELLELIDPAF